MSEASNTTQAAVARGKKWKTWLSPVAVVVIILVALLLLANGHMQAPKVY